MPKICRRSNDPIPVTQDQLVDAHVLCPGCGKWTAIKPTTGVHGQRMARLARHHVPTETLAAIRNEITIRYTETSAYDAATVAAAVFRALTERKLAAEPGTAWGRVDSISVREGDGLRVVPPDLDDEIAAIEREVIASSSR